MAWIIKSMGAYILLFGAFYLQGQDSVPTDMVAVQGGNTEIGSKEGRENEKPVFPVFIPSFLLDQQLVTVAQFRLFTKISRYITDAEKKGEGKVWEEATKQWRIVKGAYWEYPQGRTEKKAHANAPVTQISWNDAKAYATWVEKRLPTEFELEYASQKREDLEIHYLNGNLWEWSDTWYVRYDEDTYYSRQLNRQKTIKGGVEPEQEEKNYRPSVRQAMLPHTTNDRTGFRCARNNE